MSQYCVCMCQAQRSRSAVARPHTWTLRVFVLLRGRRGRRGWHQPARATHSWQARHGQVNGALTLRRIWHDTHTKEKKQIS